MEARLPLLAIQLEFLALQSFLSLYESPIGHSETVFIARPHFLFKVFHTLKILVI